MSNIVGSLIGGAASIGGTIGSYLSAQAQNDEARRQFDESMRFSKYQYADMKRYNSPENQLRLMRQAGINPALAIGQLPNSAAVGVGTPGSTASMVQPDFSGLQSLADIAAQYNLRTSQEASNYADASNKMQDAIGKGIDNAYKHGNNKRAQSLTEMQTFLAEQNALMLFNNQSAEMEYNQWKAQEMRARAGVQLYAQKYADETYQGEMVSKWMQALNAYWTGQASLSSARAAMLQAVVSDRNEKAQHGFSKSEREHFFKVSTDLLQSSSYKNWLSPAMTGLGSSVPTGLGLSRANRIGNMYSNPGAFFGSGYNTSSPHKR